MGTIVIECPSCPQKMRIPAGKSFINVQCDNCHYSWTWKPTVMVEVRKLDFRCSTNSQEFSITYARATDGDSAKLVPIETIITIAKNDELDERIKQNLQHRLDDLQDDETLEVQSEEVGSVSLDFFDLSSWGCPICSYKAEAGKPMFYRCGKCEQLVCPSRSKTDKTPQFFVCHPECGYQGEVNSGGKSINEVPTHNVDIRGQSNKRVLDELKASTRGMRIEYKKPALSEAKKQALTETKKPALPKPTGTYVVQVRPKGR